RRPRCRSRRTWRRRSGPSRGRAASPGSRRATARGPPRGRGSPRPSARSWQLGRSGRRSGEQGPMPRRRRKSKLRPKTPSRIKKRKRATKPRGRQHPELWGLVLLALGLFLGTVIYAGWNGGYVGGAMADGLDALIGAASLAIPIAFVVLGGLMVARS